jgi:hypothetical protein
MARNLKEVFSILLFPCVLMAFALHLVVNRIHCRGTTYDVDLVVGESTHVGKER